MVTHYSSFLIVLFLSSISFSKALKNGFTVKLIHRDSPKSPFYNPSETQFQRAENAVLRSIDRANYYSMQNSNDVETTVIPIPGEYLMSYSVGTPPFKIQSIVDTGSNLVWTQCQPCTKCFKQNQRIFNPSNSSSYNRMPCSTATCLSAPGGHCNENKGNKAIRDCAYKISYGDGSVSKGDIAIDSISLFSTNGSPVSLPNIVIGCGHENFGTFHPQEGGIVGLGNGPLSLATQLQHITKGKFSYCLTPMFEGKRQPSKLHFGDYGVVSGNGAVTTPIVPRKNKPSKYSLVLEAWSVGDRRIGFPNNGKEGNIIIDSGTPLTVLPNNVYKELESAVANKINLNRVKGIASLNLCYKIQRGQDYAALIPQITAHFRGGADVVLNYLNAFVKVREEVICLAFRASPTTSIFGSLVQQDLLVDYDQLKNTVTFKATDCSRNGLNPKPFH